MRENYGRLIKDSVVGDEVMVLTDSSKLGDIVL